MSKQAAGTSVWLWLQSVTRGGGLCVSGFDPEVGNPKARSPELLERQHMGCQA